MTVTQTPWWKDGVVYQIYPASFKDSNGDGLGDIPGIISKLDYLKDLGVDIIWVSPMYDSPQFDMGYDISNYEAVYPPYGTVADMESLIAESHARGMRLILDLVVNHTSHQHAWFQESRSSRDNPKRDWYIWRPARYDEQGNRQPPNNWRSAFYESVWEWDEHTQEYYLHLFCKEQPDLNWENPDTRKAIYDSAMRFWLDKGVDGFRIDTVNMYSKPPDFPDAAIVDAASFEQPAWSLYCNGPRMHEYLREMNREVLAYYDAMTVGELGATPIDTVLRYIRASEKQLNMVFQFDHFDLGNGHPWKYDYAPWTLSQLKDVLRTQQTFHIGTDAWTVVVMENHDQARSVSRFASDAPEHRALSAKMLATLCTTLTGTLFIYQGQEIGMVNIPRDWPVSEYRDVEVVNYLKKSAQERQDDLDQVMRSIQLMGRDNARLPMQWDSTAQAGFTTSSKPWIRVHDQYGEINAAQQSSDPDSVLSFWKTMLQARKKNRDIFVHGLFELYEPDNNETFVFSKTSVTGQTALTVLNFTDTSQPFRRPQSFRKGAELQLFVTNYGSEECQEDLLRPFEARVYFVTSPVLN